MSLLSVLGYAGLIPFMVLPLLYLQPLYLNTSQALELYYLYSALILGFMAGVLWPVLHSNNANSANAELLALSAVAFPVLSFLSLLFAGEYFLPAQACLFVLLRFTEHQFGINVNYSADYRALRNRLTLLVSISHLLLYGLINSGL